MEELIQQIVRQVGLDPKQAQQVVGVVHAFLKERVPAELLDQVIGFVSATGAMAGDAAGAAKDAVGGAKDAAAAAQDTAGDAAGGIMSKLGGLLGGDDR